MASPDHANASIPLRLRESDVRQPPAWACANSDATTKAPRPRHQTSL
jgi:hypothetical protein